MRYVHFSSPLTLQKTSKQFTRPWTKVLPPIRINFGCTKQKVAPGQETVQRTNPLTSKRTLLKLVSRRRNFRKHIGVANLRPFIGGRASLRSLTPGNLSSGLLLWPPPLADGLCGCSTSPVVALSAVVAAPALLLGKLGEEVRLTRSSVSSQDKFVFTTML